MRIAVLTSLYPSPGRPHEGIFAERRWLGMVERGHQVRVVHPLPFAPRWLAFGRHAAIASAPRLERRGTIEVERPRYLHWPGRSRGNAERFARAGLAAIDAGPDAEVVVLDYAWPAAAAATRCAERGLPCVVSGRGSDVILVAGEAGLADELARGLRAARHWCAVSSDLVRRMDELAGIPGRGVLVPNGVDLELFHPRDRTACRRALGIAETDPLVLVVGHLIPRKDPLLSLEVFARGAPRDARLVFVGRGDLSGALERAIAERGLGLRATLVGELPPAGLALWYGACDLLLLTSTREGRPNVVLEALASGRSVLATDAGGTSELLGPHAVSMLARTREPAALAEQLGRLLAAPVPAEALRALVQDLSWEASSAMLEGVLAQALGR